MFLIILLLISTVAHLVRAEDQVPESVLASVNGEYIYQDAFDRYLDRQLANYLRSYGTDFSDPANHDQLLTIKQRILQTMVSNQILLQASLENGIFISEEEIATEMKNIKANYPNEEAFFEVLKQVKYTIGDLKNDVILQNSFDKLADHFGKDETISEEEAKKYYQTNLNRYSTPEQVRAKHILVETKEEIQGIFEKLTAGADFTQLAKEKSSCPSSQKGGDLGYFARGQMVAEFEYVAFNQEIDVIGQPIQTEFGWHIVKVVDKKAAVIKEFTDVQDEIFKTLLLKKKSDLVVSYLRDKLEKSNVQYYADFMQVDSTN